VPQLPQDFDWSVAFALAAKQPETDAHYAALRFTSRTYVSKTFLMQRGTVQDLGQPARYIHRVFDHPTDSKGASEDDLDWTEHVVHESPGGRVQITLQVARAAGAVRMIQLRRVTTTKAGSTLDNLAEFDRAESSHLVSLFKSLDDIPIEGDTTVLVDDRARPGPRSRSGGPPSPLREGPRTIPAVHRERRVRRRPSRRRLPACRGGGVPQPAAR